MSDHRLQAVGQTLDEGHGTGGRRDNHRADQPGRPRRRAGSGHPQGGPGPPDGPPGNRAWPMRPGHWTGTHPSPLLGTSHGERPDVQREHLPRRQPDRRIPGLLQRRLRRARRAGRQVRPDRDRLYRVVRRPRMCPALLAVCAVPAHAASGPVTAGSTPDRSAGTAPTGPMEASAAPTPPAGRRAVEPGPCLILPTYAGFASALGRAS